MVFVVYHTKEFDKKLQKFSKDFKEWVDKIEDQLIGNPYVGNPISVPWFREKKKGKYRIYYLIYNDFNVVYKVGISEKNDQQIIINTIWLFIDGYGNEISSLIIK